MAWTVTKTASEKSLDVMIVGGIIKTQYNVQRKTWTQNTVFQSHTGVNLWRHSTPPLQPNATATKVHAASVFLDESCYFLRRFHIAQVSAIYCVTDNGLVCSRKVQGRNIRGGGLLTTREREEIMYKITISTQRCWMARVSATNQSCCLLGCLDEAAFREPSQTLELCTARRQTERKVCSRTCRIASTLLWRTSSLSPSRVVSLLMPILSEACFVACKFPAFHDLFARDMMCWVTVCAFIYWWTHKRTRVATVINCIHLLSAKVLKWRETFLRLKPFLFTAA